MAFTSITNHGEYISAYYLAAPIRSLIPLGPIDGREALTITNSYLSEFADHVTRRGPQPG